jgi:hypothetical protein
MLTLPAPEGPVNPAELPVADAVLEAACLPIHDPRNYNQLYQVLATRHPQLKEELYHRLLPGNEPGAAVMAVAR